MKDNKLRKFLGFDEKRGYQGYSEVIQRLDNLIEEATYLKNDYGNYTLVKNEVKKLKEKLDTLLKYLKITYYKQEITETNGTTKIYTNQGFKKINHPKGKK